MSHHTDFQQMYPLSAPIIDPSQSYLHRQDGRSARSASPKPHFWLRITGQWTVWVQRRHMDRNIKRMSELSAHLLDDVGMYNGLPDMTTAPSDPNLEMGPKRQASPVFAVRS